MIDLFTRGGPLMYPILLCSVMGWAIFMERIYAFIKVRRNLKPLFESVKELLLDDKAKEAVDLCSDINSPLASLEPSPISLHYWVYWGPFWG